MDDLPSPKTRKRRGLRLQLLCGLLLITVAAFVVFGQLPEPGEERQPPPLERWYFQFTKTRPERELDVIFVPTPQAAVDKMLELAELKPGDVLYDLGCGDGRIVVTAAKRYGVRAIGVDIDPVRVVESRRNVKTNGVAHLVTILREDIFELDFRDASAVTLYLLPELNVRLMPKLAQLKPGTRIISFEFEMAGAKPETVVQVPAPMRPGDTNQYQQRILKWTVPWEPEITAPR
jgi:SAM-dependent methyltransferase